jgi:hypothetical protein
MSPSVADENRDRNNETNKSKNHAKYERHTRNTRRAAVLIGVAIWRGATAQAATLTATSTDDKSQESKLIKYHV